jgi:N-glycosylase/DNA lyase
MNKLELHNYNLPATLLGGQAFNWNIVENSYYGFTQSHIIKIIPKEGYILWQTYPNKDDINMIISYMNLDIKYEDKLEIIKTKDSHISNAIEKYNGLRILNQPFEQTLLSFILSSHKSVKGVRKAVKDFTNAYGRDDLVDGIKFNLFPKVEDIQHLSEEDYRKIGFGFRSRYFKEAVNKLLYLESDTLQELKLNEYNARNYLITYTGIGEKIADCIMTFSMEFSTITPLDVWGKRVLTDLYNIDPTLKYSQMREWYKNYFGEHTAIAGQYLFEYIRNAPKINK